MVPIECQSTESDGMGQELSRPDRIRVDWTGSEGTESEGIGAEWTGT